MHFIENKFRSNVNLSIYIMKMSKLHSFLLFLLQFLLFVTVLASGSSDIVQQVAQQNQQPGTEPQATLIPSDQHVRLPKINIYINKNEIKKLLGIQSQINYVTNGNINAYPFNFAIPLGLNQSDIIFTWQNLGTTNVNYSISLAIHNLEAVDPPLINITRTGLIPKHEQVFKITLPCSGKVNDEVDVQVLINISGYAATDDDDSIASSASTGAYPRANNTPTKAADITTGTSVGNGSDSMQSDQASAGNKPQQKFVSHILAIRRKKICTAHQVPVAAPADPFQTARRPEQALQPKVVQQVYKTTAQLNAPAHASSAYETHWPPNQPPPSPQTQSGDLGLNHIQSTTKQDTQKATIDQQMVSKQTNVDFPSSQPPAPNSVTWRFGPRGSTTPSSPIPDELMNLIAGNAMIGHGAGNRMQHPTLAAAPTPAAAHTSASPFLPSLVAISLLISVALVVVIILIASPFEKLNRLTRCLLKRSPAPVGAIKCKSPMAGTVISSLRAGSKSAASSVSGLSAISGQTSHSIKPSAASYCYKTNCANSYFTNTNQYQQQHYQHPPTADLLGTGYQCHPPPPPQYPPIYHIATGNSNQTTRLIWQNGNGANPDGFTIDGSYMPLSNAPRSDNGSVYQTIY